MSGEIFTVPDLLSTIYRFHEQRNYVQAMPVEIRLHPATLSRIVQTCPSYALKEENFGSKFYILGIPLVPDITIDELDVVKFVVPSYLMVKVVGMTCPVLTDKPEYNGMGDRRD